MKALLVIDVDNIDDIENTQATYIVLRNNNHTYQMSLINHWLKPIPNKKEIVCPTTDGITTEIDGEYTLNDYLFDKGYNDCIDEILGEE